MNELHVNARIILVIKNYWNDSKYGSGAFIMEFINYGIDMMWIHAGSHLLFYWNQLVYLTLSCTQARLVIFSF